MMKTQLLPAMMLLGFAAAAANAQTATPATNYDAHGAVVAVQPVYTPAMRDLQASAQRLRETIQALAQKPPGPERKAALDAARKALRETQQAMVDLPPQYRATGTQDSTAGYDPTVRELMHASDSLRDSIHAMAERPAGPGRNQAIRDANHALLDLQGAMANAYDLTASEHTRTTLAVQNLRCEKLADATVCH